MGKASKKAKMSLVCILRVFDVKIRAGVILSRTPPPDLKLPTWILLIQPFAEVDLVERNG